MCLYCISSSYFDILLQYYKAEDYWFEFKNIFVLDSPFIEEGYMLYNITLRPKGANKRMKP